MSDSRIAIVGPKEAVAGFALLGVDIVSAYDGAEAAEALLRLKRSVVTDAHGREQNVYGIVFVTEDLAAELSPEDEKKLARGALPAIIPLPALRGLGKEEGHHMSYGLARLKRIVERAIGSDILQ